MSMSARRRLKPAWSEVTAACSATHHQTLRRGEPTQTLSDTGEAVITHRSLPEGLLLDLLWQEKK